MERFIKFNLLEFSLLSLNQWASLPIYTFSIEWRTCSFQEFTPICMNKQNRFVCTFSTVMNTYSYIYIYRSISRIFALFLANFWSVYYSVDDYLFIKSLLYLISYALRSAQVFCKLCHFLTLYRYVNFNPRLIIIFSHQYCRLKSKAFKETWR